MFGLSLGTTRLTNKSISCPRELSPRQSCLLARPTAWHYFIPLPFVRNSDARATTPFWHKIKSNIRNRCICHKTKVATISQKADTRICRDQLCPSACGITTIPQSEPTATTNPLLVSSDSPESGVAVELRLRAFSVAPKRLTWNWLGDCA
jgi:hypothetical protein